MNMDRPSKTFLAGISQNIRSYFEGFAPDNAQIRKESCFLLSLTIEMSHQLWLEWLKCSFT